MTNSFAQGFRGGRVRPSHWWLAIVFSAIALAIGIPRLVSAHAEPERAFPAISGVVETAPTAVEIWFSEEANPEGTTIQVIGPGGIQVDLGDASVDLQDAERKHATVSLRPGLGDGVYTVQWHSVSGADGDEAQGGYIFTVGKGALIASPAAVAGQTATPMAATSTPGPDATPVTAAKAKKENFDSGAFGLSVIAGLGVAVLIFVFWRVVRPGNPKFRN